ncbi:hypothetical protein CPB83DRAFT_623385 [Crepidotus variabilis]|uniref:Uncharacterized protein n=1 Tax=Crepidotus variabilis TaxID=179855 RepID=A0A9P6EPD4_9AGAR|nr:hypothetical protein CPB83DRAFT_623385 [Crepidotus variabilis]
MRSSHALERSDARRRSRAEEENTQKLEHLKYRQRKQWLVVVVQSQVVQYATMDSNFKTCVLKFCNSRRYREKLPVSFLSLSEAEKAAE